MAVNYPGPYTVQIGYTVSSFTHALALNCDLTTDPAPGELFSNILAKTKSGGTTALDTAVDNLITYLAPMFSAECTFDVATLWKNVPQTYERIYRGGYAINEIGTNVGTTVEGGSTTLTWKTEEGGLLKMVLLENHIDTFGKHLFSTLGVPYTTLNAYLTGVNGWVLGRDTSWPVINNRATMRMHSSVFDRRFGIG